jgi:hypothetical protein
MNCFSKITLSAALSAVFLLHSASAQVSFTGSYSQNFDSLSTGTNLASLTGWSHHGAMGGDNATWMATIPSSGTTSAATPGTANNPKEENGKLDEEPQMKQVQGHGSLDGHDFDSPCG